MLTDADDTRLRAAALTWLTVRSNDGADPLSREDLESFKFEGTRVPLIDRQRGIRKPHFLRAALSIVTVYRPEGQARPYEDSTGSDGLIRYKWRGDDPNHAENRALREAGVRKVPLIWFMGVGPGWFQPVFPVFVAGEEPDQQEFALAVDEVFGLAEIDTPLEAQMRRYVERMTKQRLHQPVFRSSVLRAYSRRCAVCSISHGSLLDAAHIVPDSHELGVASVRNGLSLCKLHHAAFDSGILGVRPDLTVQIRKDILEEVDGPMLQHGLQARHGEPLMVLPTLRAERPDISLLGLAYERFTSRQVTA